MAKLLLKHYLAIFKSRFVVVNHFKYYFQFNSKIKINTENLFRNHYGIESLFKKKNIDAVLSRVDYVERNEPRSIHGVT